MNRNLIDRDQAIAALIDGIASSGRVPMSDAMTMIDTLTTLPPAGCTPGLPDDMLAANCMRLIDSAIHRADVALRHCEGKPNSVREALDLREKRRAYEGIRAVMSLVYVEQIKEGNHENQADAD